MKDLAIHVGGVVVGPDDVLVVRMPDDTYAEPQDVIDALDHVGLSGRSVVLVGDFEFAVRPATQEGQPGLAGDASV